MLITSDPNQPNQEWLADAEKIYQDMLRHRLEGKGKIVIFFDEDGDLDWEYLNHYKGSKST